MNEEMTSQKIIEHHAKIIKKEKEKLMERKKTQSDLRALVMGLKEKAGETYNNRESQIKQHLIQKRKKLQETNIRIKKIKSNESSITARQQYLKIKKQFYGALEQKEKIIMEIKLLNTEKLLQKKKHDVMVQQYLQRLNLINCTDNVSPKTLHKNTKLDNKKLNKPRKNVCHRGVLRKYPQFDTSESEESEDNHEEDLSEDVSDVECGIGSDLYEELRSINAQMRTKEGKLHKKL